LDGHLVSNQNSRSGDYVAAALSLLVVLQLAVLALLKVFGLWNPYYVYGWLLMGFGVGLTIVSLASRRRRSPADQEEH